MIPGTYGIHKPARAEVTIWQNCVLQLRPRAIAPATEIFQITQIQDRIATVIMTDEIVHNAQSTNKIILTMPQWLRFQNCAVTGRIVPRKCVDY